eukprot:GGOE01064949.1.p1 GENE.GGOE01064949.1~~GGOE01064949.1.p1  ORF type:complete len:183 (+),score=30.20 GGOE01064949.1:36-551(+)
MDPWRVLGVPSGASREQIKARYLTLAKQFHPDRGGSHRQWVDILHAYQAALNSSNQEAARPHQPHWEPPRWASSSSRTWWSAHQTYRSAEGPYESYGAYAYRQRQAMPSRGLFSSLFGAAARGPKPSRGYLLGRVLAHTLLCMTLLMHLHGRGPRQKGLSYRSPTPGLNGR